MTTQRLILLLSVLGAVAVATVLFAALYHPADPMVEVTARDVPASPAAVVALPVTSTVTVTDSIPSTSFVVAQAPTAQPSPPEATPVDAGVDELAKLRDEVPTLRDQVARLERQVASLENQSTAQADVAAQLQALRAQLATAVAEQQAVQQQTAQQAKDVDDAVSGLISLDAKLAIGDVAVDDTLNRAQPLLKAHARSNLDAMRSSIANKDLSAARVYLQQAILDAQAAR